MVFTEQPLGVLRHQLERMMCSRQVKYNMTWLYLSAELQYIRALKLRSIGFLKETQYYKSTQLIQYASDNFDAYTLFEKSAGDPRLCIQLD